jgi:hypothetical protein
MCVLSACSSPAPAVADAAVDVAVDTDPCASPYVFTPVTVTGTTPRGSLDIFHYAYAGHTICGPEAGGDAYGVEFSPNQREPDCSSEILELWIFAPYSTTGTSAAAAFITVEPSAVTDGTDQVTFEATQLDPPDATPPHIIGHFVSHNPVWSFDIAVDLISQFDSYVCI